LAISAIQGSTLGPPPVSLLLYIRTATKYFSVLFTDDNIRLGKGPVPGKLTEFINSELQKIANWFRLHKMAENTSKTNYMIFRTHGKTINPVDCNIVF
jgi:hypothetical protein